jgi:hypothetical protein
VGGFGGAPGNVSVFAVNSSGWLTGDTNGSPQHAALYNGSSWSDIGTLGGSAHGRAIDSAGDVGGDNNTGTKHAWFYSVSGGLVDLGTGNNRYSVSPRRLIVEVGGATMVVWPRATRFRSTDGGATVWSGIRRAGLGTDSADQHRRP